MKLTDNQEQVSLLVNIYIVHSLKNSDKSVNLQKFVEEVHDTFKNKGLSYSETEILLTWKELLEEYYYYKKNYSTEFAASAWNLFTLMDNCFDPKDTSEKFTPALTYFLIECMSNHREILATKGLTPDVLDSVENDFRELGGNEINQSDIYARWEALKQSYRESRLRMKQRCRNLQLNEYYDAMRVFYQSPEFQAPRSYNSPAKRRIIAAESAEVNKKMNDINKQSFNSALRYHLLVCIKNKKHELGFNKKLSPSTLKYIIEEFKKIGCYFTSEAICNEWNDLYYRYELLKSNDNPNHWKYFNDLKDICYPVESVVVENIESNSETEVSADILEQNYNKKYTEIPELRELMLENNFSGDEVTYLLNSIDT